MSKSFEVEINPTVLRHAVETSGYLVDEILTVATHFPKRITSDYLKSILNGERRPLYSDLQALDKILKRGIPFYFLPAAPDESLLANFRRKARESRVSPTIIPVLREYNELRKEIAVLSENLNHNPRAHSPRVSLNLDPKEMANTVRAEFAIDRSVIERNDPRAVFKIIREKIESKGIYVFRDNLGVDLRGCILLEGNLPPLIIVNTNDDKNAEIFTLLHEYGHYLLGIEELDTVEGLRADDRVENWCNEFAFGFLISLAEEANEGFAPKNKNLLMNEDRLAGLSKKYKVSKHALVFRFKLLRIISVADYLRYLDENSYKIRLNRDGGGDYYRNLKSKLSPKFSELVYTNYESGKLSLKSTFDYLKVHSVERMSELVGPANG